MEDDSIFEKNCRSFKKLKNTISHLTGWGVQMEAYRYILKLYRSALETGNYEEKLRQVEPILKN